MPSTSQLRMFSSLILFQIVFFTIINCNQNDNNELEECKILFDAGNGERIKEVLRPVANSIKNFKFTKPDDYFKIFSQYQDAIKYHKNALSSSKMRMGIFPSNAIGSDYGFEDKQILNAKRGQIKKAFGPFMKALKKPLVEYNCLINPIKFYKEKTIQDGLDIIMNAKIYCCNEPDEKQFGLCERIYHFLKELGFSFKKTKLETTSAKMPRWKKYKPTLETIQEEHIC